MLKKLKKNSVLFAQYLNKHKQIKSFIEEMALFSTLFPPIYLFSHQSSLAFPSQLFSSGLFIWYNYKRGMYGYMIGNGVLFIYTVINYVTLS